MSSLAFILGVVPLAAATGAGAVICKETATTDSPTFCAVVRQLSSNASSQKGRVYGPDL